MGEQPHQKMYNIKGLPRPDNAKRGPGKIPYAPNLPLRYEISKLATSTDPVLKKQWTLFVLALDEFKSKPVADKLSYFQVAGIHCYPEVPWDGAPAPRPDPDDDKIPGAQPFGGYCNHNGLNFPTWHRPYMLLFEQRVWETMGEVIKHWVDVHKLPSPEEKKWSEAADSWRLPYWDWAAKQTYTEDFACPEILVQGPVRIFPPKEVKNLYPKSGLYPNPFWSFENPEKDEHDRPKPFGKMGEKLKDFNIKDHDGKPWSQTTATSRYGITKSMDKKSFKGLDGVNNAWKANQVMGDMRKHWYDPTKRRKKSAGEAGAETADDQSKDEVEADPTFLNPGSLADSVNRLFSPEYTPHWEHFASTKWYNEGSFDTITGFLSLEYIHNNVHNIVGGFDFTNGLGHMSDVPVAAFDPIFWLHHCQVDRLLAIWQCLYPERWWDLSKTTAHDAERVPDDTEKDKLYPFHNKDLGDPKEDAWTAELCRDWTALNYQYDDIWAVSQTALKDGQLDEDKFKIKLHDYINDRYPHTGKLVSAIRRGQKKTPDGLAPVGGHFRSDEDKEWSDYIINVIYDRYALNGASYSIEFYLGGPSDEDRTVFHPHNLVGNVYNFGGGVRDTCSKCKAQESAGVLSRAQVPITIPLLHHAVDNIDDHPLDNYVNDTVAEYLKLHLRWRFVRFGGDVVDASKFPKTQVKVLRGVGRPRRPRDLAEISGIAMRVVNNFSALATNVMPAESHTPVYRDYVALPDVTQGKPWGLQETGSEGDRYF